MNPSTLSNHLTYLSRAMMRDGYISGRIVECLRRNERLDPEQIAALQSRELYRTLQCAIRKLPYYSRTKLRFDSADSAQVLREYFPLITKSTLLAHREELFPNKGRIRAWQPVGSTSGTTGRPLTVVRTFHSVLMEQAFLKRFWAQCGFAGAARRATLRGDMIVRVSCKTPPFWFVNPYNSQLVVSTRHLTEDCVEPIIDRLERFSPAMLQAYPSSAYALARYLAQRNRRLKIPLVFTSSEVLYPHQRAEIETMLGARVFDMYGMAERVALATECAYGSMHVNSDYSWVEILDEYGNPTDQYGSVVGTTFYNFAMPLVRYKVSDRTRWKPGRCACGSAFPVIEPVTGRIGDQITGSRGQIVSTALLAYVFKTAALNITKSQIAQIGPGRWEVRLVPTESFREEEKKALVNHMHTLVDPGLCVSVVMKPDLPNSASGKFRWVVNEQRQNAVCDLAQSTIEASLT